VVFQGENMAIQSLELESSKELSERAVLENFEDESRRNQQKY
jgi:hypothetical protein